MANKFVIGPDCHVKITIGTTQYPFWVKPGTYQHQKVKLQSIEPTNNGGLSHMDYGTWKHTWSMTLAIPNSLETPADGSFQKTGKQIRDDLWTCYENTTNITFTDIENTAYSAFVENLNEAVPNINESLNVAEEGIEYVISIRIHEA